MARSQRQFERWIPHDRTSWPFRLFQQYNRELEDLWHAHWISMKSTYAFAAERGAQFNDSTLKYLRSDAASASRFKTIRSWSDAMNNFDNWNNINVLLSIASNLETYMASAISLAIESDPGLLLGATKAIDGALIMKSHLSSMEMHSENVEACVKGEWSSRLDALEKLFGDMPPLRAKHKTLERVRSLRNKVGHAFGRDIEDARKSGVLKKLPMETLTRQSADRIRQDFYRVAKEMDATLLNNHIGEYEVFRFYAKLYESYNKDVNQGQRAAYLKKAIGVYGAVPRAKTYCNGLVRYWEAL